MAEYTEADIVKHWGLRLKEQTGEVSGTYGEWLVDSNAIIFSTTCPRVAEAQLEIVQKGNPELAERVEVAEIKKYD